MVFSAWTKRRRVLVRASETSERASELRLVFAGIGIADKWGNFPSRAGTFPTRGRTMLLLPRPHPPETRQRTLPLSCSRAILPLRRNCPSVFIYRRARSRARARVTSDYIVVVLELFLSRGYLRRWSLISRSFPHRAEIRSFVSLLRAVIAVIVIR